MQTVFAVRIPRSPATATAAAMKSTTSQSPLSKAALHATTTTKISTAVNTTTTKPIDTATTNTATTTITTVALNLEAPGKLPAIPARAYMKPASHRRDSVFARELPGSVGSRGTSREMPSTGCTNRR